MKAYLAGPFFCSEQRSTIALLQGILEMVCGVSVFNPSRDCTHKVLTPEFPIAERLQTFQENMHAIEVCDFMVASTDGMSLWDIPRAADLRKEIFEELYEHTQLLPELFRNIRALLDMANHFYKPDTGTSFEQGAGWAFHKPIITYSQAGVPLNVMLSESVVAHCVNKPQLIEAVGTLKDALSGSVDNLAEKIAKLQARFKYLGPTH